MKVATSALEGLAAFLQERAGLKIGPDRYQTLETAMSGRLAALGLEDPAEYVRQLRDRQGSLAAGELGALLPEVTVGTTYFFRDVHQFRALEKRLLPELLRRARARGSPGRIWSAGCASGEEAYSLAMLLAEAGATPSEVSIWATDVNPEAVARAARGQYSGRRMAGLPGRLFERYFQAKEDEFAASAELRAFIRFEVHNLAASSFVGVAPASFDLILCRNVIIYFDLPTVRGLMDRFRIALRREAHLLLGYSESLFQIYDRLEMVEIEGAFIYRPLLAWEVGRMPPPAQAAASSRSGNALPTAAVPAPVAAPSMPADLPREARPEPPGAGKDREPQKVVEQAGARMERGEFEGALTDLQALIHDRPGDISAWLTLGNALSLFGRFGEARDAFAKALELQPLCVEARLYGGMAAMQAGSLREARAELGRALYLDPNLALGHYLLAQVEERMGERSAARKHYRNAIAHLARPQRQLAGYFPDMADSLGSISAAARCALRALEAP